MKLFIVTIPVPDELVGSPELGQILRASIELGIGQKTDEELTATLESIPEGDGPAGVLVYRRVS